MTTSPRTTTPAGRRAIQAGPPSTTTVESRRAARCPRRPARPSGHLTQLGVEITASRLRVLGHPARLRIMRALEDHQATIPQLSRELGLAEDGVRAHVRLLHRAGILGRVDNAGPPLFALQDWPSMWMVDQFARRLREQTSALTNPDDDMLDDEDPDEGFVCR